MKSQWSGIRSTFVQAIARNDSNRFQSSRQPYFRLEELEERILLDAAIGNALVENFSVTDNSLAALSGSPLQIDKTSFDDSRILVRFHDDVKQPRAGNVLRGTRMGRRFDLVSGLHEITLNSRVSVEQALAAYQKSPLVAFAEPDYRVHTSVVPNDPGYGQLWGMEKIEAPLAWDTTTGDTPDNPPTVVAVIDTGVDYTHTDLAGNIWVNADEIPGNSIDDDNNGYVDDVRGWDFFGNDNDPMDEEGHGTHVAGTIGATGNNGIGVAGVNWDVQIMPLRFLGPTGGFTSDAVLAIDYAVANGATISNNSWGGGGFSQSLYDAIQSAQNSDHIFVAAAGNDGTNNDFSPHYPSNYNLDNIISVAASDQNDNLATFSNYGATTVDLAAPGVGIYSTLPNNSYGSYSGTSMASPHVAGVVALARGENPNRGYQEIIQKIYDSTDLLPPAEQGNVATGGRLNAAKAVEPLGPDVNGPRIISPSPAGIAASTGVSSVRVKFNEAIASSTFTAADVLLTDPDFNPISVNSVTEVGNSNEREFDISFAAQSALGVYNLTIGPNITDVAEIPNLMNQDGDEFNGETNGDDLFNTTLTISEVFVFTSTDSGPILDGTISTSHLNIPDDIEIADIDVEVDINHTYDADLQIDIFSPSGQAVVLSYRNGGSGDNYKITRFDDEAATSIISGSAPFNGSYQPEQVLSAFDGESSAGLWELDVTDWVAADTGYINSWTVYITAAGPPPPPNDVPVANDDLSYQVDEDQPLAVNATNGVLTNDSDPDDGPGTLTATLVAGPANAELFSFHPDGSFNYTPTADFNGIDSFTYVANDGQDDSNVATATITVDPVNDAPVASDDSAVTATNDSVIIDVAANDTDVDANLDLASIVVVSQPEQPAYGDVVVGQDGTITYTPDSDFAGTDSFTYQISDTGGLSDVATVDISVLDLPGLVIFSDFTIDSYGGAVQDEEGPVTVEDGGITLHIVGNRWKKIDIDYTVTANTILEFDFRSNSQGEVHGIGFDDDLALSSDRTFKVHGTQNWGIRDFDDYSGSGVQHYQIPVGDFYTGTFPYLLFANDHDVANPPTGESYFSNVQIYELVEDVNTPPVITLTGDPLSFNENSPATVIDSQATVSDSDSPNFENGELTVSLTTGGTAADRLSIRNEGSGAGQIGVSGSNVTFEGAAIGSFVGGGDGTTPLVVTLNVDATVAATKALAQNITYANVSEDPATAARTVSFVLTDGDGGSSQAVFKTINVIAINDLPVVATNAELAVAAGETATIGPDNLEVADVDNTSAELTLTLVTAPTNGQLVRSGVVLGASDTFTQADIDAGLISYTHDGIGTESDSFDFSATDGTGPIDDTPFNISISDVPNLPGLLNFNDFSIGPYGGSNQDKTGPVNVDEGGSRLQLVGNRWKKIDINYTVTANTILEFDFKSTSQGEVHGIGFDTDLGLSANRTFKVYGTQNWGIDDFDNYSASASDVQHYRIRVGGYETGTFPYLFFANDHDVSNPDGESFFSNVQIYEGDPSVDIDFEDYTIDSYAGSGDKVGPVTVEDEGATLHLAGNRWKKIDLHYTVTPDTVLEFDFRSPSQGEVHGIGFDTDLRISRYRTFKVHGTQNWGINDFDNYSGNGVKHYQIPVGEFFTGTFPYLIFANDHDVSNPTGEGFFSNVRIYEQNLTSNAAATVNDGGLTVSSTESQSATDRPSIRKADGNVGQNRASANSTAVAVTKAASPKILYANVSNNTATTDRTIQFVRDGKQRLTNTGWNRVISVVFETVPTDIFKR